MKDRKPGEVIAEIGRVALEVSIGTAAPPPFRMLTRTERWERDRRDPGCQHGQFVVDDKRRTVECGQCGQIVDPFDAVMSYATWADWYVREHREWKYRCYEDQRGEARHLKRARFVTEGEQEELEAWLRRGIPADPTGLTAEGKALCNRIGEARRDRKYANRKYATRHTKRLETT